MRENMRALKLYGPGDIRVETVPVPKITDDEILIKVRGCGICGNDIKIFYGSKAEWGAPPEKRFIQPPIIGGHEFYGEIVQIGKNVKGYEIGELVTSEQVVPCGKCRFCRTGNYWMCPSSDMYGFRQETPGGFAEYMKLHKRGIHHKIPAHFTPEQASLIEPFSCAMHAVERANIQHYDTVVVAGLGAIGQAMTSIARTKQPKLLIGLDIRDARNRMALKNGADLTFNPMNCDVEAKIKALTDGYGCDVYMEASGSPKSINQGFLSLRNQGRYVQFGIFSDEVLCNLNLIGDEKELDVLGSHLGPYCYDAVIRGIDNGSIPTEGVVTHKFTYEQWAQAYDVALNNPDALKVILVPEL